MTLNMLCALHMNPKLSVYELLKGNFEFNSSSLAPPISKVVIHEKPQQWKFWAPHGNQAWYIGLELEHYQCYRIYIPETHLHRQYSGNPPLRVVPTESA